MKGSRGAARFKRGWPGAMSQLRSRRCTLPLWIEVYYPPVFEGDTGVWVDVDLRNPIQVEEWAEMRRLYAEASK